MTKYFTSVLVAVFVCITASAQIGIVGGLTSSKTDVKSAVSDYRNITLFQAGLTYKIKLGEIFALQPSLVYNMKGSSVEQFIEGGSNVNLEYKTGYLELPVQVQAGLNLGKILRLYALAEPFVGYALSNNVVNGSTSTATWDNIASRVECGVGVGAGVEILEHLQVSLRYFWNLGNVYDFSWDGAKAGVQGSCNGITATIAVLL